MKWGIRTLVSSTNCLRFSNALRSFIRARTITQVDTPLSLKMSFKTTKELDFLSARESCRISAAVWSLNKKVGACLVSGSTWRKQQFNWTKSQSKFSREVTTKIICAKISLKSQVSQYKMCLLWIRVATRRNKKARVRAKKGRRLRRSIGGWLSTAKRWTMTTELVTLQTFLSSLSRNNPKKSIFCRLITWYKRTQVLSALQKTMFEF